MYPLLYPIFTLRFFQKFLYVSKSPLNSFSNCGFAYVFRPYNGTLIHGQRVVGVDTLCLAAISQECSGGS